MQPNVLRILFSQFVTIIFICLIKKSEKSLQMGKKTYIELNSQMLITEENPKISLPLLNKDCIINYFEKKFILLTVDVISHGKIFIFCLSLD